MHLAPLFRFQQNLKILKADCFVEKTGWRFDVQLARGHQAGATPARTRFNSQNDLRET